MEASSEEVVNRRGSLSISALLNDNPVDPVSKRKSISSDDRSSSASPNMTAAEIPAASSSSSSSRAHISKAKRKRISPQQYNRLMEIFDQTDTPSSEIRENLAEELDMTKREVQVWFQNRRAKVNRSKNLVHTRHRQSSLIPPPGIRVRRLSSNDHHHHPPLLAQKQQQQQQQHPRRPSQYEGHIRPPPVYQQQQQQQQQQPFPRAAPAMDLLASAAEYVTNEKEIVVTARDKV